MPKQSRLLLLLTALVITMQFSCARSGSRREAASASTPNEQARIDEILQRYEDAIGGKEAIASITSYRLKGTYELAGMKGTLEGWRKEPRKTLNVFELPRIGTLKKGFDGETNWVQTPEGTFTDSSPQEVAQMERDAEVFSAGRIRSLFDSMKLENRARLNGRDMYVIEGKPAKGPAEKLFFDVENGLLVRWDMARRQQNRTLFVKAHLDDYQQVGNVKVPFKIRFAFESFNFTINLEEVQHNVPIDDAIFKKP
jgi:zinc protease